MNKKSKSNNMNTEEIESLINFNDIPINIGMNQMGKRWYTPNDVPKIIEWAKQKLPTCSNSVKIIGTLAGRMPQSITLLVAFKLTEYVDELRYSGMNFPTVTIYNREA